MRAEQRQISLEQLNLDNDGIIQVNPNADGEIHNPLIDVREGVTSFVNQILDIEIPLESPIFKRFNMFKSAYDRNPTDYRQRYESWLRVSVGILSTESSSKTSNVDESCKCVLPICEGLLKEAFFRVQMVKTQYETDIPMQQFIKSLIHQEIMSFRVGVTAGDKVLVSMRSEEDHRRVNELLNLISENSSFVDLSQDSWLNEQESGVLLLLLLAAKSSSLEPGLYKKAVDGFLDWGSYTFHREELESYFDREYTVQSTFAGILKSAHPFCHTRDDLREAFIRDNLISHSLYFENQISDLMRGLENLVNKFRTLTDFHTELDEQKVKIDEFSKQAKNKAKDSIGQKVRRWFKRG